MSEAFASAEPASSGSSGFPAVVAAPAAELAAAVVKARAYGDSRVLPC